MLSGMAKKHMGFHCHPPLYAKRVLKIVASLRELQWGHVQMSNPHFTLMILAEPLYFCKN